MQRSNIYFNTMDHGFFVSSILMLYKKYLKIHIYQTMVSFFPRHLLYAEELCLLCSYTLMAYIVIRFKQAFLIMHPFC